MIKVLIVDDSALIRKILTDILHSDKDITVVGTARNGKEALEKIKVLKPDIITLDIEMPLMDGLTTLKHIVSEYNLPVIMISSLTSEGANLTLRALDEGAVDFLTKPSDVFSISQGDIKKQIIDKIKIGARTKCYIEEPIKVVKKATSIKKRNSIEAESFDNIVAIGTSTGGPRALQTIIPSLPNTINGAVLIVQHMPSKFTKSLADRLDSISNIKVKEAEEGDIVTRGYVYIAPGDYHMTVHEELGKLTIRLNQEAQVMGLRPTVDKLMESMAKIRNYSKIGVILTGMGSDGANGIIGIKKSGGYTIAQDELSSVVYGMPKSAILTNCIDEVLPLNKIADRIIKKVGV